MRYLLLILFACFCCYSNNAFAQCGIEITHVSRDTLLYPSKTEFLDNICVKYKIKRRNKLAIYADGTLGEIQEIIEVIKLEKYTEIEVINSRGATVTYRFYKDSVKLETFIETNKTHIIETGIGLSYKISKWAKGKKHANTSLKTVNT